MTRPRAADDFAAIRARMKELRYERERAEAAEIELRGDPIGGARPSRPLAARRDQHGVGTDRSILPSAPLGRDRDY